LHALAFCDQFTAFFRARLPTKHIAASSAGISFVRSSLLTLSLSFSFVYLAHSSATVEGFIQAARCRKRCLSDSLVPAVGGLA
jgi:hypothetical protein